jgi:hypothetical protein
VKILREKGKANIVKKTARMKTKKKETTRQIVEKAA